MSPVPGLRVAVLTGGFDRPYAFGFTTALAAKGIRLDVIGSKEVDAPAMHTTPGINFLDLIPASQPDSGIGRKLIRLLLIYLRQIRYAAFSRARIFHILWNNKIEYFDRTFLALYYKLLGKRIALTAHNVNARVRDGNDSYLNRLTLRLQYGMVDHIFVHTESMKRQLVDEYAVDSSKATVIPFGINNSVPNTSLTPAEARKMMGIDPKSKTLLFFGSIQPYKGLLYLVSAFREISGRDPNYRLIIAGDLRREFKSYWDEVQLELGRVADPAQVIQKIQYVPDEDTELYFKAADAVVLPYTHVFQSGVLFLAHSFGVPVIATDVGSIREEIVEGRTGFLCRPCDSRDVAATIERYFASPLFADLEKRRKDIQDYANARHSWDQVSTLITDVYEKLGTPSRPLPSSAT